MRGWGLVGNLLVSSGLASSALCFYRFFYKGGDAWNVGRGFTFGVYAVAFVVQLWVLCFGRLWRSDWGRLHWFSLLAVLHLGSYVGSFLLSALFPKWDFVGDFVRSTARLREDNFALGESLQWVDIVLCVSVFVVAGGRKVSVPGGGEISVLRWR